MQYKKYCNFNNDLSTTHLLITFITNSKYTNPYYLVILLRDIEDGMLINVLVKPGSKQSEIRFNPDTI